MTTPCVGIGTAFVGREREMVTLREMLAAAGGGQGSVALLVGDPGIGKTRTAEELAARARETGAIVRWGRCFEGEGAPAFWPWVQVLRSHVHERAAQTLARELGRDAAVIAQIIPEVRERLPQLPAPPSIETAQARFRLFDAVTNLLKAAAGEQPLVVVLDDLHWADAPSLMLLQFLTTEIRQSRLLLIGTYRQGEAAPGQPLAQTLGALAREPHVRRLLLDGLSEGDVRRFAALTAGRRLPDELVGTVARQTEGNPFFVAEVVRLLAGEGHLERWRESSRPDLTATVPPGVRDVISRRLSRLSDACRRVLTVSAVIGREFSMEVLSRVTELAGDPLLELLEEAETARLIEVAAPVPGRYRFVHALVRDTLYIEVPSTRRVRLHREVGEALAAFYQADDEPHLTELAYHFTRGAAAGDVARAIDYARRAGNRALALLAYEEAAEHFERALDLLELRDDADALQRCDLLLALGDAQSRSGQVQEARQSFEQAAAAARRSGSAHHMARAALGYGGGGVETGLVNERLIALLEEALAALDGEESGLRARLLARLAMELYWADARERRVALSGAAVELGRRVADASALAFALSARHLAFWEPENVEERLAVGAEHLRVADLAGDRQALLEGHARRLPDLLQVGDLRAARQEIESHARLADELRQPTYRWEALRFRAMTAYLHGRFDEMERLARDALALAERAQIAGADVLFVSQLQFLRREQGRYPEMEAPIKEIIARYPRLAASWRLTLVNVHAQTGRLDEARRELDAQAADGFASLGRVLYSLGVTALLTEAIVAVGDRGTASVIYERLLPYARHYIVNAASPNFYGAAAHYLGMLAATMSHWGDAIAHLESALVMNTRTGVPSHIATTQFEYAKALLHAKRDTTDADVRKAHALLEAALGTARDLGMRRIVEQIEQLQLRERSTPTPRAGLLADLTPRETEVLGLLASGMSNREIAESLVVTVNTVERHLVSVYGKLGVRGRAAATAYALRHGLI